MNTKRLFAHFFFAVFLILNFRVSKGRACFRDKNRIAGYRVRKRGCRWNAFSFRPNGHD